MIEELAAMPAELRRGLRFSDIKTAYIRAKARVPSIEVPSRLSLLREPTSLAIVMK
ncbi:MAG: hypothetical protein ABI759_24305 [Candidatus Solibacter sp.]